MYSDILTEIGKFANIDLHKYKYICEECKDKINYDQMICCIYSRDTTSTSTFNEEIEFFRMKL